MVQEGSHVWLGEQNIVILVMVLAKARTEKHQVFVKGGRP